MKAILSAYIIVTIFTIVYVDWYVLNFTPENRTVTLLIREISYDYPIFVFLLGVIFGHLYWK